MTDEMSADEYNALADQPKRSKYGNVPTEVHGTRFHSQAEAMRYTDLCMFESAGAISDLTLQPKFEIVVNGDRIGSYSADFAYIDNDTGERVIEDVKGGQSTPVYRLKKRLVEALYDVKIREVRMR